MHNSSDSERNTASSEAADFEALLEAHEQTYWVQGKPSEALYYDYALGLVEEETRGRLAQYLDENRSARQRLEQVQRALYTEPPTEVGLCMDRFIRDLLSRNDGEPGVGSGSVKPMKSVSESFVACEYPLNKQVRRVVRCAESFVYVTNFFGGVPKAAYETGHSNLKYAELEAITERILEAIQLNESLSATVILQDFEAVPELILARQRLRNDEKYIQRRFDTILDYVAGEISDVLHVFEQLSQITRGHPTVKLELRVTKGLVAFPAISSSEGAAVGTYLSNLSDYVGPTQFFAPATHDHNLIRDHCDIYVSDSIVILGEMPHWRAEGFLRLGLNRSRLRDHLHRSIPQDPVLFSEYFIDQRQFLGPEF